MGPPQRLKKSRLSRNGERSVTAQFLVTAQFKRRELFHFLFLRAGRAEIKVLTSKVCLC